MDIFHISLPVSHGLLDKVIKKRDPVETVKGTGNRNMEEKQEIEEVDINEKYGRNFTEQHTLQAMGVVVMSPPMGL